MSSRIDSYYGCSVRNRRCALGRERGFNCKLFGSETRVMYGREGLWVPFATMPYATTTILRINLT
jgi:hypothetical protein